MLTAILLSTAIVIAVGVLALCKVSGECSRIEESAEWARKRNEARVKDSSRWCMDECLHCEENDWCKFSEVHHDNN